MLSTTPLAKSKGTSAAGKSHLRGQSNCRQRVFPRQFGLPSITLLGNVFVGSFLFPGTLSALTFKFFPADMFFYRQVLLSAGNTFAGS